jgi:[ribosomal protein S5]-alanine N-acetyltransferase
VNQSIFDTFPILETERLRLRRVVAADAGAWLAVWNDPDVMRYLVEFDEGRTDIDEVNGIIAWCDDIFAKQTGMRWAITLKPDDTLIGTCGFHLYSARDRWAEIGYELGRAYWRQGIMREALGAVLAFGFGPMNLHRVEANVTVGNEASAGILRRLGFTLEGTWREKEYARGRFHDLWQFGLLEQEYRG